MKSLFYTRNICFREIGTHGIEMINSMLIIVRSIFYHKQGMIWLSIIFGITYGIV